MRSFASARREPATGTTSSYVDAWFVGYVPTLSTSVWMGYKNSEDPAKGASMNVVHSGRGTVGPVFGGTLPAATWADFMKSALTDENVPVTDFNQPPPLQPLADAIDNQLRQGISPGYARSPVYVGGGGPFIVTPGAPNAYAPTTTAPPQEATTSTTSPSPGGTTTTVFLGGGGGPPIGGR